MSMTLIFDDPVFSNSKYMLKLKFQDGRFMTVTYEPYKIKIIPLQKGKKNNKSYNNNKEKRREIARDVTSKKRENRLCTRWGHV